MSDDSSFSLPAHAEFKRQQEREDAPFGSELPEPPSSEVHERVHLGRGPGKVFDREGVDGHALYVEAHAELEHLVGEREQSKEQV